MLEHAAPLAPLGDDARAVGAALALELAAAAAPRLGVVHEAAELGDSGAVGREQLRRCPRDVGQVVEVAREAGGVASRERDPQRVRRPARLARGEHALDRRLAGRELAFEHAAALVKARQLGAQGALLGAERGEPAVRFRNRALGLPQRVARLAPRAFLVVKIAAELVDAAAQRAEIFFPVRGKGIE
jgi:hypothetical protein